MKYLFLFVFTCFTLYSKAQDKNLVHNPSFEEYYECPNGSLDAEQCKYWSNPSGNYFNKCSPYSNYSVPFNELGQQSAFHGQGYMSTSGGFLIHHYASQDTQYVKTPYINYYDLLLQTKLKTPLEKDKIYNVSFYISPTENTNVKSLIGAVFSQDSIDSRPILDSTINDLNYVDIVDTITSHNFEGWHWVHGTYKAKGGEQYFAIGHIAHNHHEYLQKNYIKEPKNNKTINITIPYFSYYYIDMVAVTLAEHEVLLTKKPAYNTELGQLDIGKEFILGDTYYLFRGSNTNIRLIGKENIDQLGLYLDLNKNLAIEIIVQDTSITIAQKKAEYLYKYLRVEPIVKIGLSGKRKIRRRKGKKIPKQRIQYKGVQNKGEKPIVYFKILKK